MLEGSVDFDSLHQLSIDNDEFGQWKYVVLKEFHSKPIDTIYGFQIF